jgi:hypothetical protein
VRRFSALGEHAAICWPSDAAGAASTTTFPSQTSYADHAGSLSLVGGA